MKEGNCPWLIVDSAGSSGSGDRLGTWCAVITLMKLPSLQLVPATFAPRMSHHFAMATTVRVRFAGDCLQTGLWWVGVEEREGKSEPLMREDGIWIANGSPEDGWLWAGGRAGKGEIGKLTEVGR